MGVKRTSYIDFIRAYLVKVMTEGERGRRGQKAQKIDDAFYDRPKGLM